MAFSISRCVAHILDKEEHVHIEVRPCTLQFAMGTLYFVERRKVQDLLFSDFETGTRLQAAKYIEFWRTLVITHFIDILLNQSTFP